MARQQYRDQLSQVRASLRATYAEIEKNRDLAQLYKTGIIPQAQQSYDAGLSAYQVGILLSALFVGGEQIQITMGLPASVSLVLQGMILLFVLGGDVFTRYRLKFTRKAPVASQPAAASAQEA